MMRFIRYDNQRSRANGDPIYRIPFDGSRGPINPADVCSNEFLDFAADLLDLFDVDREIPKDLKQLCSEEVAKKDCRQECSKGMSSYVLKRVNGSDKIKWLLKNMNLTQHFEIRKVQNSDYMRFTVPIVLDPLT